MPVFRCLHCGRMKEDSEFYKSDLACKMKLCCKKCFIRIATSGYQEENQKDKAKAQEKRWLKYGLTQEAYTKAIESSAGRCPICLVAFEPKDPNSRAVMDHRHAEHGERFVRGIICSSCNTGIVKTMDRFVAQGNNPLRMKKMIARAMDHWGGKNYIVSSLGVSDKVA